MPIGCADTMAAENATIIRHMLEPSLIQNLHNGSRAPDVSGAANGSFGTGRAVPNANLSDREGSTAAVWRRPGERRLSALSAGPAR
jgi:hypothetical protein